MVWWLWLACGRPAAPVEAPAAVEAEPLSVRFAPDGRVIVADRFVLEPASELGPPRWTETGGPSPLLDGVPPPPTEGYRRLTASVDEDRLYVHTIDRAALYGEAGDGAIADSCRVIDVRTGAATTPKECVHGDFYEIWRVQMRGGLVAVDSSGEGHPGLTIYAWDPEGGASEVGFPELDQYPFGPVDGTLRADGGVDLMTPCHLGEARPCQAPDGEDRADEPWRHYRWRRGGAFELVREGLPAWIAADPTGDRYAWADGARVCVGLPGDPAATCVPAPHP